MKRYYSGYHFPFPPNGDELGKWGRPIVAIVIIAFFAVLFFSCDKEDTKKELTFNFVGDLMCVSSIKGHNIDTMPARLTRMLSNVKPILMETDHTVGNLETPVYVPGTVEGWRFNANADYIEALTNVGFNILSFANNHACDQGAAGVESTLFILNHYGIVSIGAGARRKLLLDWNGILISFIAYSYGLNHRTNGHKMINTTGFRYRQDKFLLRDIRRSAKLTDIIILMLHWGHEYETNHAPWQRAYAEKVIDLGVDVIIGSHAHVPQPIEIIVTKKSNRGIVAYSLGNFIGAKITPPQALVGMILQIAITKDKEIYIKKIVTTKTKMSGKVGNRIMDIDIMWIDNRERK